MEHPSATSSHGWKSELNLNLNLNPAGLLEKCLLVASINKKKNVVKDVAELIANIDEELVVDDEILVEL